MEFPQFSKQKLLKKTNEYPKPINDEASDKSVLTLSTFQTYQKQT